MTKARSQLVSLDATPYYHCVSRCVRRAFLCGKDAVTGNDYEHRRQWIEDRLFQLEKIFAIDIAAYAIMSNHYHVVLHVNSAVAEKWSTKVVIKRWQHLFKGTLLTQKYLKGNHLTQAEIDAVEDMAETWRQRLMDISWFIRCLNESIAREANREDGCTGRFWEGRFKSQALLDEKALAACMAYVDLNPVRAKMAKTPEASKHTSVKRRAEKAKASVKALQKPNLIDAQPKGLMPFAGNPRSNMPAGLPFCLTEYLELVDWTGRQIRANKRGAISAQEPPMLERLGITSTQWLTASQHFESRFKRFVGSVQALTEKAEALLLQKIPGIQACRELLTPV
ncbi:transposase [Marinibactrum halimedae]|uniref:Transposase n=1 Tax=Marinibactrum halimedae TaxID=1444977 RepID=A0AA37T4S8_9GAMM|nr:transposase [Marinibactrum halimedae]MCD9458074.1 transposase [Marinibactrum halimedae]GLS25007.1 transposase [Marinibactrum halimedae]